MLTDPAPAFTHALITGASSGIGAAFARRLAHAGTHLTLVARGGDRLAELAAELRVAHGVPSEVLVADLSRAADVDVVAARLGTEPAVDLLINNAGFGAFALLAELDPDQAVAMLQVHVVALTRLTQAAVTGMVRRGRGAIVNVSSTFAFLPYATIATYCGTKAYILAFTEALSAEVQGTGVRVQALCPAGTKTELFERAGVADRFDASQWMEPAEVVEAALAGLAAGEVVCLPGLADAGLLAQRRELLQSIFQQGASGVLADRYGPPVPQRPTLPAR